MIKLNRVGNKLGLAGLIGILLSIGVVANQMRTETTVAENNLRADEQQRVVDFVMQAESEMRSMRLANRGQVAAKTRNEIDKAYADLATAKAAQDKGLDAALAMPIGQEAKARLSKVKDLTARYANGASQTNEFQKKLLELYRTRNVATIDWDRHLSQLRLSTAVIESSKWPEVDLQLRDADIAINAVRASAWRFTAMGEATEKMQIGKRADLLTKSIARAASLAEDGPMQDVIALLSADAKKFMAATDEAIKVDDTKASLSRESIVPAAKEASELMAVAVASAKQTADLARSQAGEQLVESGKINVALGAAVVLVLICTMVFPSWTWRGRWFG